MPQQTSISKDTMPTCDEMEQVWSAASEAFHRAMPEGPVIGNNWGPEHTTKMRRAAGAAAFEKVIEILSNR